MKRREEAKNEKKKAKRLQSTIISKTGDPTEMQKIIAKLGIPAERVIDQRHLASLPNKNGSVQARETKVQAARSMEQKTKCAAPEVKNLAIDHSQKRRFRYSQFS